MSARGGGRRHYLDRRRMGESQRLAGAKKFEQRERRLRSGMIEWVARARVRDTASRVTALPYSRKVRAVAE